MPAHRSETAFRWHPCIFALHATRKNQFFSVHRTEQKGGERVRSPENHVQRGCRCVEAGDFTGAQCRRLEKTVWRRKQGISRGAPSNALPFFAYACGDCTIRKAPPALHDRRAYLPAHFWVLSYRAEWICRFGSGKLSSAAGGKIENSGLHAEKTV